MERSGILTCLVLPAMLFASSPVFADCVDYRDYLHCVSRVYTPNNNSYFVTIAGQHAYVATTHGLMVVDISDPYNPWVVGSVDTPDPGTVVAIDGNYAFLATSGGGWIYDHGAFIVIDVSNPASPQIVASISMEQARGVALADGHAFVTTWNDYHGTPRLRVFDISDPPNPAQVGMVEFSGSAHRVAVAGGYAYVAARSFLQVIDVSVPESPRLVHTVEGFTYATGVTLAGTCAYVTDSDGGRLDVLDISVPQAPVLAGGMDCSGPIQIAVTGDRAYLASVGGAVSFRVLDLTDPFNPVVLGSLATGGLLALAVFDHHVYATSGWESPIIDIASPRNPAIVDQVDTPGSAVGVVVSGSHAYVADTASGVLVADISNPGLLRILATIPLRGQTNALALSGDYVCAAWGSGATGGFEVIDVSNPLDPRDIGSVSTPGPAVDVAVFDGNAYVVDQTESGSHFLVIGLHDPRLPIIRGATMVSGRATGVDVSGGVACVAEWANAGDYRGFIETIDVTSPTNPWVTGSAYATGPNSWYSHGVTIAGHYAYATIAGLFAIDIVDPSHPQIVNTFDYNMSGCKVTVSGTSAYVPNVDYTAVYDLSDPTEPAIMGESLLGGQQVAVSGDLVYGAGGDNGFYAAPAQCDSSPTSSVAWKETSAPTLSAFPVPASRQAGLRFLLPRDGRIDATLHDASGRLVRSLSRETFRSGTHTLLWDGRDDAGHLVAPGVYLAKLVAAGGETTGRFVIVR